MFRWYAEAVECYAYLSDVRFIQGLDSRKSFAWSAWFTRGWTLQELLAPVNVIFLDQAWNRIGTKRELLAEISAATGIADQYLKNMCTASVASKMSWISRRETSRVEDIAYCLLGIFDVNMPLLYGEGEKAFLRLELEIIKQSDDESIFAWTSPFYAGSSGLLALWPSAFANSADISSTASTYEIKEMAILERQPYSMTNKGLEIFVPRLDLPTLTLNCWKNDPKEGRLGFTIKLHKFGTVWQRIECGDLKLSKVAEDVPYHRAAETQKIIIRQDRTPFIMRVSGFEATELPKFAC